MIMEGPVEGRLKPETIVEVFVRTVNQFKDKTSMNECGERRVTLYLDVDPVLRPNHVIRQSHGTPTSARTSWRRSHGLQLT